MITLKAIGSSRDAQHYFERDNYYTQSEGYAQSAWTGKGAEALGLSGAMTSEAFKDLLDGRIGEAELGRVAREAVRAPRRLGLILSSFRGRLIRYLSEQIRFAYVPPQLGLYNNEILCALEYTA